MLAMMWQNLKYHFKVCPITIHIPACCQILCCLMHRSCLSDKLLQLAGARREIDYKVYGCSVKVFGVCMKGHCFI